MKKKNKTRIIATILAMFSLAGAGYSQPKWFRNVNGTNNTTDEGSAVTVDGSGNVYMTGFVFNASTNYDIVTTKYNAAGTLQWSVTYSGTPTSVMEKGNCIAVDANGYVYVAATAYNGLNSSDFALLRYTNAGVMSANYPKFYADASGTEVPEAKSVVVVSTSEVYVSGSTYSTTTGWKLIVHKDNVGNAGWNAGWSAPYTYQGSVTTTRHEANDLRADANSVYVTGVIGVTSQGTNCVTAELSASNGSQSWATTYNGANSLDDCSNAVSVDVSGNVWIAGYSTTTSNGKDALIIKYNGSGSQQWATTYNGSNNLDDAWNDIVTFSTGGSTIAGVTGYKTISNSLATMDKDYMTATYNSSGTLWTSWATNPVFYNGSKAVPESSITDEAYAIECLDNGSGPVRLYVSGRSFETPTEMDITSIGYTISNGSQYWIHKFDYGASNHYDEMFNKYGLYVQWNVCNCIDEVFVVGNSYTSVGNIEDCVTIKYSCQLCFNCCRLGNPQTEQAEQSGFFPNPFSTKATLRIDTGTVVSNATLNIYDISGKQVLKYANINTNEIPVERASMENGIYFYELVGEAGVITSGKFVIEE